MVLLELAIFFVTLIAYKLVIFRLNRLRIHATFERTAVKGPKPSLIGGNWREYHETGNPNDTIEKWLTLHGDVFGYFLGDRAFLVVNDLELIQKVFLGNTSVFRNRISMPLDAKPINVSIVNLKNERWKTSRKIISPTFSSAKVTSEVITSIIQDCVGTVLGVLPASGQEPFVIDVYERMQAYTLDVIAHTALNMQTNVHDPKNSLTIAVRDYFRFAGNPAVDFALFFGFLRPVLTFINNYLTAGRMMDMVVKHVKSQIKDILDGKVRLLDPKSQTFLNSLLSNLANKVTTEEELLGNVAIILLAGYETTANALTYTLYLLAKNPRIQEKLRSDLKERGTQSEYLEMVWMESLRYYPPVTLFVIREASEDITIDNVTIEKGTHVQVPVWHIHHRADIWEDPYVFNPERFGPSKRESIPPGAFSSFGLGPRTCLGNNLATWEAKLLLTTLLTKFKIEVCEETCDPLPLICPTVIINPAKPVYLKFQPCST